MKSLQPDPRSVCQLICNRPTTHITPHLGQPCPHLYGNPGHLSGGCLPLAFNLRIAAYLLTLTLAGAVTHSPPPILAADEDVVEKIQSFFFFRYFQLFCLANSIKLSPVMRFFTRCFLSAPAPEASEHQKSAGPEHQEGGCHRLVPPSSLRKATCGSGVSATSVSNKPPSAPFCTFAPITQTAALHFAQHHSLLT